MAPESLPGGSTKINLGEDISHKKKEYQYFLKPNLFEALKDVGAIPNKSYTGLEIQNLFCDYIELKSLINPVDDVVICDEKLKLALNVKQVVRSEFIEIIDRQLIREIVTTQSAVAGPSQCNSSQTNNSIKYNYKFILPTIPDPISDEESIHSYDGYETALCVDSDDDDDDEEVDDEELLEGELELVTEDEEERRDSDSDGAESVILEIWGSCETSASEDDNFADESDNLSDSDSEQENSDDEKDSWPCVSCGIKNKPLMRYCEKCWQTRKDCFPDRPKRKRKRKPRPKKKRRTSLTPVESFLLPPPAPLSRSDSTTTQSSVYTSSSQDSGFCSQEFLTSDERHASEESAHLCEVKKRAGSCKRKKSSTSDELKNKIPRISEIDDKVATKFRKFVRTRDGKRWLMDSGLPDYLKNYSSDSDCDSSQTSRDLCIVCFSRPVSASIIHGRLSHIAFCYPCAKKLYNSKKRCPICRRKIHMITKNAYP